MLVLLKLIAHDYPGYCKIGNLVKLETLEGHDREILKAAINHYEEHKLEKMDLKIFSEIFLSGKSHQKDKEVYSKILKNMREPLSDSVKSCVVNQIIQANIARDLTDSLYDYEAGKEIDLVEIMEKNIKEAQDSLESTVEEDFFAGIDELLDTSKEGSEGYTWPLECLNDHLRPLQAGDDMIIAARPDKGKTTFLAQMACHIAAQTKENEIVVWLNNEGPKKRILRRVIQSSMRLKESVLNAMISDGTLNDKYAEAIGGLYKIQIYDIHQKSTADVKGLLNRIQKKYTIKMIIFDMADNIRYAGSKKADRTDEVLEKLYIWARELATLIGCITIKTSQVSDPGHGVPFPSENLLKDSRTGKQGATDTILIIGHDLVEGNENVRYISAPKNKLRKEGSPPLKAQVVINMDRAFYAE